MFMAIDVVGVEFVLVLLVVLGERMLGFVGREVVGTILWMMGFGVIERYVVFMLCVVAREVGCFELCIVVGMYLVFIVDAEVANECVV